MKKILLCLAAVIGVLSLLILVPTSPALIVDDPATLIAFPTSQVDAWGEPVSIPITVYSLLITVGAALGILLTGLLVRRSGMKFLSGVALALTSGAFALICSHLVFCLLRWSYILNDLGGTPAYLFQFWKGGYSMYGAILGGLLGMAVYGRVKKQPLLPLMDSLVPGMALLILLGRAAEATTLQGRGSFVANEALSMLPFVVEDEWGTLQLSVYIYEAILAGFALLCTLALLKKKQPAGRAAETGLTIISLGQVIFDSWRGDELITFGFVRLNMILAACVLAVIIGTRLYRIAKRTHFGAWCILRTIIFLFGAALVIAIEFALDKSTINNTLLYGVMAATLGIMSVAVLKGDGRQ